MASGKVIAKWLSVVSLIMLYGCQQAGPREQPASTEEVNPTEPASHVIADEVTVAELHQAMMDGELTSRQIVDHYIAAIERENERLRAVISINPQARVYADILDGERATGRIHGPLHGIPVILKDNINTGDPMPTTAGSLALIRNFAKEDAGMVKRLREDGAIILAKANLSEWANFRSTRSVSGWSGAGGQTTNPYDTTRNTCGSSSGSGVSVAANLAPLAVGTETDGSVVCPASVNGVVGIKPTLGLVSRSGIVPLAHSQDTAGPMARTVTDAVLLLDSMVGADERDPLSVTVNEAADGPYMDHLNMNGLAGKRIGVLRELTGFHPGAETLINAAIETMREHGAEIIDPVEAPNLEAMDDPEYTVLLYEFKADLNEYLAGTPAAVEHRSLEALIEFNNEHAEREMPWFGQEIFIQAQETDGLDSEKYLQALETSKRLAGAEGIDAILAEHDLDAIIALTTSPAWKIDQVNSDHYLGGSSSLAAVSGYPNITVPVGFVHGLPVGMSVFGAWLSEGTLIEIAYAYEQATMHRRPPPASAHGTR
jgi:amidase